MYIIKIMKWVVLKIVIILVIGCGSKKPKSAIFTLSGANMLQASLSISPSHQQPWRLQFASQSSNLDLSKKVIIRISNNGSSIVNIDRPEGKSIILNPKDKKLLFEGSLGDLFLLGQSVEDLVIVESRTEAVDFTFNLEHDGSIDESQVSVYYWKISY